MKETMLARRRYQFFGRVQGVGFRYRAQAAAGLLELTGWVENLEDGSVLLEAQGTEAHLDRLMGAIVRGSHWIEIQDMTMREIPLQQHEYGFGTRGW